MSMFSMPTPLPSVKFCEWPAKKKCQLGHWLFVEPIWYSHGTSSIHPHTEKSFPWPFPLCLDQSPVHSSVLLLTTKVTQLGLHTLSNRWTVIFYILGAFRASPSSLPQKLWTSLCLGDTLNLMKHGFYITHDGNLSYWIPSTHQVGYWSSLVLEQFPCSVMYYGTLLHNQR